MRVDTLSLITWHNKKGHSIISVVSLAGMLNQNLTVRKYQKHWK